MSKTVSENFSFDKNNLTLAKRIIAKYPEGRQKSAIIPLLDIAQRQNGGWLSISAIEYVANMLSVPYIRAYEVASFYSMFNLKPIGKYHIQICGTTPCWLRGSNQITTAFEKYSCTKKGETSSDGMFTISEVECLGACVNAPMVQINDDYYENLDEDKVKAIIDSFKDEFVGSKQAETKTKAKIKTQTKTGKN